MRTLFVWLITLGPLFAQQGAVAFVSADSSRVNGISGIASAVLVCADTRYVDTAGSGVASSVLDSFSCELLAGVSQQAGAGDTTGNTAIALTTPQGLAVLVLSREEFNHQETKAATHQRFDARGHRGYPLIDLLARRHSGLEVFHRGDTAERILERRNPFVRVTQRGIGAAHLAQVVEVGNPSSIVKGIVVFESQNCWLVRNGWEHREIRVFPFSINRVKHHNLFVHVLIIYEYAHIGKYQFANKNTLVLGSGYAS